VASVIQLTRPDTARHSPDDSERLSLSPFSAGIPLSPRELKDCGHPENRRLGPCVDGSGLARRIFALQHWSEQPCVRPVLAVLMTADRPSSIGRHHGGTAANHVEYRKIMQRIAVPMIGRMISSTLLTLIVIPAIFGLVKGFRLPSKPEPTSEATCNQAAPLVPDRPEAAE
jgi:hypothetical protein